MARAVILPLLALLALPTFAGAAEEASSAPVKDRMSASCAPNDGAALTLEMNLADPAGSSLIVSLWGIGYRALEQKKEIVFSATLPSANEGATLSSCPATSGCTLVAGHLKINEYVEGQSLRGTLSWTDATGQTHERPVDGVHDGKTALCG